MTALLEISDLTLDLGDRRRPSHVLRGVDLAVHDGEVVGVVGESGCGKTTTLLAIAGLLGPSAKVLGGRIRFEGVDLLALKPREWQRLRGERIACVFQNARNALHPMLTVGRQVARVHRLHLKSSTAEAKAEAISMLGRTGIEDAAAAFERYPHELSGGQCQRVMIAMALIARPRLLLADEPTSGLDVTVQRQVLRTLMERSREFGTAMLLVSHDINTVRRTCDRIAVMYAGEVIESGLRSSVIDTPAHPYTQALLDSITPEGRRMRFIPGVVADVHEVIGRCAFADRCRLVTSECLAARPDEFAVGRGHKARCVHIDAAMHGTSSRPGRAEC